MRTQIGILAALALILAGGLAYAHGGWEAQGNDVHEQMEDILEEGTYDDLVALREDTGYTMMPFVDDEESFEAMQEHHSLMEEYHEENGFGPMHGHGMMGGRGAIHTQGGCPMWS